MALTVAMDLGGMSIKMALVENGQILASRKIDVKDSAKLAPLLPQINSGIEQMISETAHSKSDLGGIGMAFPSIVDNQAGKILSDYVKYTDTNDLNLNAWARDHWGVHVVMENDARAALAGEWQHGSGKGFNDLILVTIGTGFGSSALINGKLLRGKHHLAGNLGGHMTIDIQGTLCNCGNLGCLETVASTWALPHLVKKEPGYQNSSLSKEEHLDFQTLFEAADLEDQVAISVRDGCIQAWAFGLVSLVHAFDPEMIIVGGAVMGRKEIILPEFQKIIDKHTWLPPGTIKITHAANENHAALLGMDYLVNQQTN